MKKKLFLIIFYLLLGALILGLLLYALGTNLDFYYTPTQVANSQAPVGKRYRIGGMVQKGSLKKSATSLEVEFVLTDYENSVKVVYEKMLPSLFSEGKGAIVLGVLDEDKTFHAIQVLAKHDENYMPPEVQKSLKANGALPHDLKL